MNYRNVLPIVRAALALLLFPSGQAAAQHRLAITPVTVVDVATGALRPHQTVLVDGNRIGAVGRAEDVRIPDGAAMIDGSGTYLIPGLWDMHVHTLHPWAVPVYFPLYVALGVTGVREMGNSYLPFDSILAVRRRIQQGTLLGPRFVAAGHELDADPKHWPHSIAVRDAAHGRALVDSLMGAGADFMKVYENLPRDVYFAIVERARQLRAGWELHRRLFRVDQRVAGDVHRAGGRLLAAPNHSSRYVATRRAPRRCLPRSSRQRTGTPPPAHVAGSPQRVPGVHRPGRAARR